MRLFEFWTFYYSFLFLMDFFLKEAVHQRAFCSYIVVFFYRGKYCTTLFFFFLLKTTSGGIASTHVCGAIAHPQCGAQGMWSVCRLLRSYIISTGRFGQICHSVLQWEGLVVNFSWFYCKSRSSVSYHSPSFPPLYTSFLFLTVQSEKQN